MSRVGKMPIAVPKGVDVAVNAEQISVKGSLGALARPVHPLVSISHPVAKDMPAGITVECPTQTEIVIKGSDRQVVGQIAAEVRAIRPPEPYKGKGIRYAGEKITLKETKKK